MMYIALRLSLRFNQMAWRLYAWSENLRIAVQRVWMFPDDDSLRNARGPQEPKSR